MRTKPASNPIIAKFEKATDLPPDQAKDLLACARSTYYQWRSGSDMPEYMVRHIRALMLLPRESLDRLLKEYRIEREDDL